MNTLVQMEEVSCFLKWDSNILSCMGAASYRPNPIHILQQRKDNPPGCLGCGLPGFSYPIQEWEPFLHGCRLFCHLCPQRRQYTKHMRWRVSSHCWFATVPTHTCTQGPAVKRHKLQKVYGRDNRLSRAGLKQHQPTFMWQQSWSLSLSPSPSQRVNNHGSNHIPASPQYESMGRSDHHPKWRIRNASDTCSAAKSCRHM